MESSSSSSSIPQNLEDYSPSSTVIKFDTPIPLLRGPIPCGSPEESSYGPYVLAFKSPKLWESAYKSCESKIVEQCQVGTRIGCSISASHKCKPSWWRVITGLGDLKEREICEEREMVACLAAAEGKCLGLAQEKLKKPFEEARIASNQRKVREEAVVKLIGLVSSPSGNGRRVKSMKLNLFGYRVLDIVKFSVTSPSASELLGSDASYQWFFK